MVAPETVVIGLVLTLPPSAADRAVLIAALAGRSDLRLGEPQAHLLPLTAETSDPQSLHRELENFPGVRAVDVAFVEVASASSTETSLCS
jgi:hypothetical protein